MARDNSLGFELAEAVEGDRASLLQRSIPGWAGDGEMNSGIDVYSFCSLRVNVNASCGAYVNRAGTGGPRTIMRFTCGVRCRSAAVEALWM